MLYEVRVRPGLPAAKALTLFSALSRGMMVKQYCDTPSTNRIQPGPFLLRQPYQLLLFQPRFRQPRLLLLLRLAPCRLFPDGGKVPP